MKKVEIYTDGACSGNPGPGGYGAILVYNGIEKEISGAEKETTNNRMELRAVIEALSVLKEACEVSLCSDSKYVIDGLSKGWARSWRAKGWRLSNGKAAQNIELWQKLLELCDIHKLSYVWVKGHEGHPYNERCDKLAVNAYLAIMKK